MRWLWVLGFLLILIDVTYGCDCYPVSKKKKYCRADFVVKAKIQSPLINIDATQDFDDYYNVKIQSQIKMNNDTAVDLSRIYTATNDGLCGVSLGEGKAYYLGGRITSENRLYIELCQSLIMYSDPDKRRKPKIIRKEPRCRKDDD